MGLVMRFDPEVINGYGFGADNVNNSINILRVDAGSASNLSGASFVFDVGRNYILEAGAIGPGALSLKIWAQGDPVPQDPQVTWFDNTYGVGVVGLFVINQIESFGGVAGPFSGNYDDVYFFPAGADIVAVCSLLTHGKAGEFCLELGDGAGDGVSGDN
ncbi:hypothetical protein LCGC14_2745710, partial [marine sediment metagenome]